MTKSALLISTAVGLTVALSGSAFAGHAVPAQPNHTNAHIVPGQVHIDKAAKAKYRVAYYYSRGFETSQSTGVASFSNPSTGVYCITPTKSVTNAYPNVSVEWGASSGSTLSVFYENGAFDCAGGGFEVRTYDDSGNVSANVAFDFTVL